jgi:hypothetical protein
MQNMGVLSLNDIVSLDISHPPSCFMFYLVAQRTQQPADTHDLKIETKIHSMEWNVKFIDLLFSPSGNFHFYGTNKLTAFHYM